jgi:hypothetical protein
VSLQLISPCDKRLLTGQRGWSILLRKNGHTEAEDASLVVDDPVVHVHLAEVAKVVHPAQALARLGHAR